MKLGATLYVTNSAEAVAFYSEAFRMTVGYNVKNSDGSFLHAELMERGRNLSSRSVKTTMRTSLEQYSYRSDRPWRLWSQSQHRR